VANRWIITKSTSKPERDVTPLTMNRKAPVEKQEERQTQLRSELERQVIAKRREQLATSDLRLSHLTARGVVEDGSIHQWTPEELERSADPGQGLSNFWRDASPARATRGDGIGIVRPRRGRR